MRVPHRIPPAALGREPAEGSTSASARSRRIPKLLQFRDRMYPGQSHSVLVGRPITILCMTLLLLSGLFAVSQQASLAQDNAQVNIGASVDTIDSGEIPLTTARAVAPTSDFNLLELILKGGVLMVPIFLMSVLVVALVIERFLNLRERKILPKSLIRELGQLAADHSGFDPKEAYRICQSHPSSASTVIRSMLLKVGRPHTEVERATAEASDREASRLYGNVRWLNLVAAVAPLIGLFGTVWGMIQAFFQTTQLTAGQNKSVFLAEGIYVALVTTLGGLAVAIPAAIFSHYFEGRIHDLFYRIDELLFNLMPQVERFEGRLRMNQRDLGGNSNGPHAAAPSQQAVKQKPIRPTAPQQ